MLTDYSSAIILPLEFDCIILNDNRLYSNVYYIKLGIDPLEDTSANIGIGFQRLKYLAERTLQGSVFLPNAQENTKEFDKFDNNVVCLPCEVYDIYVGSLLMAKFQTISQNYFQIQYLTIASLIGDNVQYNIVDPYDSNLNLDGDHWWNMDNVYTGSKSAITWNELNLSEVPKFKPTVIKGGLSEN